MEYPLRHDFYVSGTVYTLHLIFKMMLSFYSPVCFTRIQAQVGLTSAVKLVFLPFCPSSLLLFSLLPILFPIPSFPSSFKNSFFLAYLLQFDSVKLNNRLEPAQLVRGSSPSELQG